MNVRSQPAGVGKLFGDFGERGDTARPRSRATSHLTGEDGRAVGAVAHGFFSADSGIHQYPTVLRPPVALVPVHRPPSLHERRSGPPTSRARAHRTHARPTWLVLRKFVTNAKTVATVAPARGHCRGPPSRDRWRNTRSLLSWGRDRADHHRANEGRSAPSPGRQRVPAGSPGPSASSPVWTWPGDARRLTDILVERGVRRSITSCRAAAHPLRAGRSRRGHRPGGPAAQSDRRVPPAHHARGCTAAVRRYFPRGVVPAGRGTYRRAASTTAAIGSAGGAGKGDRSLAG